MKMTEKNKIMETEFFLQLKQIFQFQREQNVND